jgi:hypothetical protein
MTQVSEPLKPGPGVHERPGSGMWQWRIKAPADLRPSPYRSQRAHRCSLETADLRAANASAARLQAEWTARFEQQRTQRTPERGEVRLSLTGVRAALRTQMQP